MRHLYTLAVLLLINSFPCFSQNPATATIQWNTNETFDATEGNLTEEITTLTTYGTTKIEWKDATGNIRSSFTVLEARGQWTSANSLGSIQFEVRDSSTNVNGTISIRKDSKGTKIQLVVASSEPSVTELSVQNFQSL